MNDPYTKDHLIADLQAEIQRLRTENGAANEELDRLRVNEGRALGLARRWRDGDSLTHAHALFDALRASEAERGWTLTRPNHKSDADRWG